MADILASGEPVSKRQKKSAVAGLSETTSDRLHSEVLHLCACDGVLLGADGPFQHAPCALLPYPLPAALFTQAIALAKPFNAMLDKVSRDIPWLTKTVRTTVEHDPFTRRLLEQLDTVSAEGIAQPLQLSINRSDYMIDQPSGPSGPARLLQVELNTISCSFVSLAAKMTALHTHLLERLAADVDPSTRDELAAGRPALAPVLGGAAAADAAKVGALPPNSSVSGVAMAMAVSHREYEKRHYQPSPSAPPTKVVVLMVVQPAERNVIDQRGIEYCLWREQQVPMVRATLSEVHAHAKLISRQSVRTLVLSGGRFAQPLEVSVVYFRAGYTPNDYPSDDEWNARLLLERSLAIKCPSLAQHLYVHPARLDRSTCTCVHAHVHVVYMHMYMSCTCALLLWLHAVPRCYALLLCVAVVAAAPLICMPLGRVSSPQRWHKEGATGPCRAWRARGLLIAQ